MSLCRSCRAGDHRHHRPAFGGICGDCACGFLPVTKSSPEIVAAIDHAAENELLRGQLKERTEKVIQLGLKVEGLGLALARALARCADCGTCGPERCPECEDDAEAL